MNAFGAVLESACLSVRLPICVQNSSFCQSTGGGIKTHLVTALVLSKKSIFEKSRNYRLFQIENIWEKIEITEIG